MIDVLLFTGVWDKLGIASVAVKYRLFLPVNPWGYAEIVNVVVDSTVKTYATFLA